MNPAIYNLFSKLPDASKDECFTQILLTPNIRFERIVSKGQTTPEGIWYDQKQHEWVLVLQGAARICFEGKESKFLGVGDYVEIPPHCRHRVEWTDPRTETIWLAVHFDND